MTLRISAVAVDFSVICDGAVVIDTHSVEFSVAPKLPTSCVALAWKYPLDGHCAAAGRQRQMNATSAAAKTPQTPRIISPKRYYALRA